MSRLRLSVLMLALLGAHAALAATPEVPVPDEAAQRAPDSSDPTARVSLQATGGVLTARLRTGYLEQLGLSVSTPSDSIGRGFRGDPGFALSEDSQFSVLAEGTTLLGLNAGTGRIKGGFVLQYGELTFDLRNLRYTLRAGELPRVDLVNAQNRAWVYADRLMYELVEGGRTLRIRSMDLLMGRAMADALGRPELAGALLGELHLTAPLPARAEWVETRAPGDPNWPGEPAPNGNVYQADVFMFALSGTAGECDGCDGPGGADGRLKITPNSTLSNNVNNGSLVATVSGDPLGTSSALYTADVPWWEKFTSSPNNANFQYPHPTFDQHPNLIWNLFRVDADGRLTQIGASGMKHAFLTTNSGVNCDTSNGNHVLGRSCTDLYGAGNNDAPQDLGPRRELIPSKGIWARCGSIFDPDCNQFEDGVSTDVFRDRMLVRESQLEPCRAAPNGNARCWLESWYIIRDDINIYNTMATRQIVPNWGGAWIVNNTGDGFRLGSAVDRWVGLTTPTAVVSQATELRSEEGRAKVGLRVRDLGNGTWQYDYVLMNFDWTRPVTTGVESNHTLRITRNHGFNRFVVGKASDATISQIVAVDHDGAGSNDWVLQQTAGELRWEAPNAASSLEWGNMIRFSFIADRAPQAGTVSIGATEPIVGQPDTFDLSFHRVGTPDILFANGFE